MITTYPSGSQEEIRVWFKRIEWKYDRNERLEGLDWKIDKIANRGCKPRKLRTNKAVVLPRLLDLNQILFIYSI